MRFILGALLLLALPAHGFFTMVQPWLQPEIRTGYVMTRAQVVSPEGNLFLIVEESSNTSGNPETREVRLVGEVATGGDLDGFYVLSAADIRYYQNWYKQLRAERGENLMDRAEWLDRDQLAQGVKLANGTVVTDLRLADVTKKVLVLGERDRFGSSPDGWLLMQVPYDPDQVSNLEESVTSLLFDRDGNLLDQTTGSRDGDTYTVQTFTYRTAYFGTGQEAVEQSDKWTPTATDKIFGPMTSQTVRMYEPSMPVSSTNERGLYSLFWIMPCPFGGVLDFTLELELQARSYNPMGHSVLPLLMQHKTSAACSQMTTYFQGPNFYVDLIWMAGQVRFANELNGTPLPIGEELLFDASAPELTRAEYQFDFDGDGTADTVVQANKKVEDELDPETNEPTGRQFIVPDTEGDPANYQWQAVYFSSGTRDPNAEGPAERQPDLWRVADRNLARDANNELLQAGRLTQISTEAALNTDVYIFRESTGELIVEVSGLPEAGDRRIVDNGRAYTWNTVMRGPRSQMFIGGAVTLGSTYSNQKDPQKFAEDLGISSRFIGRDTGIPGPGETLRIVAINRTTGYTGSATFTLGSPSSGDNVLYSGSINQRVPELTLTPPNLKVWARRIYDIEHGLTKGEKAEYLIGHEGAATRNDTLVAIFTEWLDEYGKPLPEGLGENSGKDFGLSGRLAKLTGNELTPTSAGTAVDPDNFDLESIAQGSAVVEFGIKPGRQAQLIRLKSDHVSNEHYYVNVFGRAINKEACPHCEYDQTGKNEGILETRPNHYTPFYVPRYDEEATLALRREQNLVGEGRQATADGEPRSPVESQYKWVLRPEYQFTLMNLIVQELSATHTETLPDGSQISVLRNLLELDTPAMRANDLIRILYDLVLPNDDPLAGFDGPGRDYVLVIGEDEIPLINQNGMVIEWRNIEHLSSLQAEDFLTVRLVLNSDPDNYLWQWAFEAGPLVVNSSQERGSRLNKSFIICNDEALDPPSGGGSSFCTLQQPIIVELNMELGEEDEVEWEIEAEKEAYGQTTQWKVGMDISNVNHHYTGPNVITGEGSGSGSWGNPWRSKKITGSSGRFLSFVPDMSEYPHEPEVYRANGTGAGGTTQIDVLKKNPRISYRVSATLNGQRFSTKVRMDHVDMIRQEHINHNVSVRKLSGREYMNMLIPERDKFLRITSQTRDYVPEGFPYNYLLDDTITGLIGQILPVLNQTNPSASGTRPGTTAMLDGASNYRMTSSYRNPERNEAIGGSPCSAHMRGRAIDIGLRTGGTGYAQKPTLPPMQQMDADKVLVAKKWYIQWRLAISHPPALARMIQLEFGSGQAMLRVARDENASWGAYPDPISPSLRLGSIDADLWDRDEFLSGVPDIFMFGHHMHIQSQWGSAQEQCG